jgi:hypothetical protein
MADKSIIWRGKKYLIPQAASFIDSSALATAPLGGGAVVAILAEMTGLIPSGTAIKVGTPTIANALIHPNNEEARLAAQLVFDPSPGSDTPGASEVYLVPVNPATRATAIADTKLVLDSYLYGLPANQVKYKIEAGSVSGKKVTIAFGTETEPFDNLQKDSLSIQYTGAGTPCAILVDGLGALTTTVTGGPGGEDLAVSLSDYPTVQALADYINAQAAYEAVVLTDNPGDSTLEIDAFSAADIKAAAGTLVSDLQAIIDALETSGFVAPSRNAGATAPPADAAWTYLAGGTNGVTTNTDWQTALDLMQTLGVNIFLPLTPDASLHSMVESHLSYMSGPDGKKERRGFVGGALQTWSNEAGRVTAAAALAAAAKVLGSDRIVHAGLGSKHYDPNGKIKLYPAYITAAMYAGIAAGGYPVQPLTRKYLRILGLEVDLRNSEITDLINKGIAVPIVDDVNEAGYVISRQITTWGKDADLYRIEFSVGQGADYLAAQIRQRHAQLIGQAGTIDLDATAINVTNGALAQALRAEYIRAYDAKKTTLRVDGTVRYIDYAAEPILPVNFIFSTYYLTPTVFTVGL